MFNPLQGYYLACDNNGGDPNNDCSKKWNLLCTFKLPGRQLPFCFRMLQRLEGPDDEHGV